MALEQLLVPFDASLGYVTASKGLDQVDLCAVKASLAEAAANKVVGHAKQAGEWAVLASGHASAARMANEAAEAAVLLVRFARKLIVVLLGQSTGKTFQAIFQPHDEIGQLALAVFKAAQADAARAERAAAAVGANAGNSTRNAHRAETAAARAQKALSTAREAADLAAQQAKDAVVLAVKRAQRIRNSLFHNDLDATAVFGEISPPLISPRTKNSSPQRSGSPLRSATRSSMRSARAGGGSFSPPLFEPPPAPLFREGSSAAELAAKHAPPPPTPHLPTAPRSPSRSPSPSLDPYPCGALPNMDPYPPDSDTEMVHHPSPNGRSDPRAAHDGAPTSRPRRRALAPAVVGADFVRLEDGSIELVDLVRDDRGPVLAPLKPKPYTGGQSSVRPGGQGSHIRQGSRGALTYAGARDDWSAGTAAGSPILGSPDKPLPPVRHPSQSLGATPRQQASHAAVRPATSWVPKPAPLAGLHSAARPATSWVPKPASLASLPPCDATDSEATGASYPTSQIRQGSYPTSHHEPSMGQGAGMGRHAWENQGLRALPSSMYGRVVTASRDGMATPHARSAAAPYHATPYYAKPYDLPYDLEAGLEVEWPPNLLPMSSVPSAQPYPTHRAATSRSARRSVRPTASSSAVSSAGLQLDPEVFSSYTGPQHETRPPTTADGKPLGTPQPQLDAPRWARASVAQRMQKASADGQLPALLSPADHRTWSFEQGDFEKAERRFERQDRRERRQQRRAARQAAPERRDGRTAEGWRSQPPPSPSYRPRTTPVAEEHGGSRNFDGVDEGGSDDVGGDEGGSDDVGGDRTTDEEAIEEVERRSEHVHARGDRGGGGGAVVSTCMQEAIEEEERFLMDQYGPRMHSVPLSSVSPRPPGQGHSPPTHVHSPRRRHNAGRAAASPAGGTLSQQVEASPRGRTPASFASYDEAAMWLGARPRVLTAPA